MSSGACGWIDRVLQATAVSLQGLRAAFGAEQAFRLELLVLAFLAPAALLIASTAIERVLLIGSWMLVLVIELINSAIETVVDRIGKEHHELSGRAKDMGSAAVLLAIVLAAFVWAVILMA